MKRFFVWFISIIIILIGLLVIFFRLNNNRKVPSITMEPDTSRSEKVVFYEKQTHEVFD